MGFGNVSPTTPVANAAYIRGRKVAGTVVSLIGVNAADRVAIDPGALGIVVGGNFLSPASGYRNFGTLIGTTGYGTRDNAGTIEFKNSGGSWAPIAASAASAGGWTDDGVVVRLDTATDRVCIGGVALTSAETRFEIIADSTPNNLGLTAYSNASTANVAGILSRVAGGTLALPTATPNGYPLLNILGRGHDGVGFTTTSNASIGMFAAELFSPTNQGTFINFRTAPLGATARDEKLLIGSNSVIVNDLGGDYDFRVEADANANLLFCDAGLNAGGGAVGIGAAAAAAAFVTITPPAGATTALATTAGNVGVGTPTFGTNATNTLGLFNGVVPSTSPADTVQLFSVDLSAGNATLGIRTETAVAVDVAVASSHSLMIRHNGTNYRMLLAV